ncbi:band 7 protein AGAP004871-like isoform X2 [Paramacrobiotus metropolitanus]|uniref:band 7 protein AGAP004871-like isoform X2 n=1 Tax=Paramacrobiotus metropolitanus TaxID=2943436 RepID=UPI0024464669|nr:band 7 protein AGAP004871-like isoform X2 [Paramacrobiotus metropolitanus]
MEEAQEERLELHPVRRPRNETPDTPEIQDGYVTSGSGCCVCNIPVATILAAGYIHISVFLMHLFQKSFFKVDMRCKNYDIPKQEILTKDSVTVTVDAVVYYRVFNATSSVLNVEMVHESTRLLAQTTLRNVLGTKALHDLLVDRETISNTVQVLLDQSTDAWGIKVERVEVKDVRLPVALRRAMAAEAEAAREARAKVIAAEGEQKAARSLKEAADVIAESPAALQLRYLQTLNTISADKNSTIIFPIPMDLVTQFVRR